MGESKRERKREDSAVDSDFNIRVQLVKLDANVKCLERCFTKLEKRFESLDKRVWLILVSVVLGVLLQLLLGA